MQTRQVSVNAEDTMKTLPSAPSHQCRHRISAVIESHWEKPMMKLSAALALVGVTLLLLSVLPGQIGAVAAPATSAPAVAAPSPSVTPPPADAAYGKALFLAKGCATCHHHGAFPASGFGSDSDIPDLTTYRWTAEYLRTWLKDPAAIKPNTAMPNLGLKQDEIEALIAFLSAEGTRT
jgi:cytochrome c2